MSKKELWFYAICFFLYMFCIDRNIDFGHLISVLTFFLILIFIIKSKKM